jgi:hypothetical protein
LPNEPGTMEMQGTTKLASIDIRKTGITSVNKNKELQFPCLSVDGNTLQKGNESRVSVTCLSLCQR